MHHPSATVVASSRQFLRTGFLFFLLKLMAHSPDAYRRLGRLVANAKGRPSRDVANEYGEAFMHALDVPATRGRHVCFAICLSIELSGPEGSGAD